MKTMTCNQLGGPETCKTKLQAETFDEMMTKSKQHGMEMFQAKDADHLKVMEDMKNQMGDPETMQNYIAEKKKSFDKTPED